MIIERLKYFAHTGGVGLGQYFWRSISQKEIDYIEVYKGNTTGFEFKWNSKKIFKIPEIFRKSYPNMEVQTISPKSALNFITK
jgi:penicillin-binding protein-related factor A (putative recombinase)